MSKQLLQCPTCKGTKEIEITVNDSSFKDGKLVVNSSKKSMIECVDCDGKGEVTQNEYRAIMFDKDIWCQCEECGHNVKYIPDNDLNGVVAKHHYIHSPGCGKVVQIG